MSAPHVNQNFHGSINAHYVGVIQENAKSALEFLDPYINHNAVYNSAEREMEEATICQPGTRTRVLEQIRGWLRGAGPSTMWLYGPAGAGKSTIASTIAEQCDTQSPRNLAFSYFFSRRNINRNDLSKFTPSFAYQLVRTIPSLSSHILEVYKSDPSVFYQRLEDQVRVLIAEPLRKMSNQIPPMAVIIDGLDEYSDESSKIPLSRLIRVLLGSLKDLPFRFFFASRPEPYIRAIFDELSFDAHAMMIPVSDFATTDDVYKYLSSNLSEVPRKGLPPSWPSESDIWTLAIKSEGIFIYASTLVKFLSDRKGNAKKRLEKALESHNGLDSLFVQVLDNAKEYDDFQYIFGVTMLLRVHLPIRVLAHFLQRDTYDIRSALAGSSSILFIPEELEEGWNDENNYIRPYHTSLLDFLTDSHRSKDHFLDPGTNHAIIVEACAGVIKTESSSDTLPSDPLDSDPLDSDPLDSDHLDYAYQNWCYHLCLVLSYKTSVDINRSPFPSICNEVAETLVSQQWTWLSRMGSHDKVEELLTKLREVISYVEKEPSHFECFIRAEERLRDTIGNFMKIYAKNFAAYEGYYGGFGGVAEGYKYGYYEEYTYTGGETGGYTEGEYTEYALGWHKVCAWIEEEFEASKV